MKLVMLMLAAIIAANSVDNVYRFSFTSIDGKEVSLSQFKGKKILIVNTASECGFTKQYAGLQELSERYADKLVVIGFPANNFGGQEPGSNEEIQGFCERNFGVTFLLAEKSSVKGDDIAPLFKYLTTTENSDFTGEVKWNFEKFLIDEQGNLIHRYRSKVAPMDAELTDRL